MVWPGKPVMTTTFISGDWGSSRLRLRLAQRSDGSVLATTTDDRGVAVLAARMAAGPARAALFEETLREALERLRALYPAASALQPIMLSGMVTSAQGWQELPYGPTPCRLDGSHFVTRTLDLVWRDKSYPVTLVSGLRTPWNVMRGEECELAGLVRLPWWNQWAPGGNAVVLLPGTHGKHAVLCENRVEDFQTYMTGELFGLLRDHSLLRHSLNGATGQHVGEAFAKGVATLTKMPLTAALFHVRTASLLQNHSPDWCRSFLDGLLVGSEILALCNRQDDLPPILCAAQPLGASYKTACDLLLDKSRPCLQVPPEIVTDLVPQGHAALLQQPG